MPLTRRTLLLAALAAAVGACTSTDDATSDAEVPDVSGSPIDASDVFAKPEPELANRVPRSVAMIGDSISAMSEEALDIVLTTVGFESVTINAEPSRRIQVGRKNPTNGLDVVKFITGAGPPEMWVIELGTNDAGLYAADEEYQSLIDSVLEVIGDEVPLVWVNTYRDDHLDGCAQFNELLLASLEDRGNATVADWYRQCVEHSSTILTGDGVHPNDDGILVFAATVRAAVAARLD